MQWFTEIAVALMIGGGAIALHLIRNRSIRPVVRTVRIAVTQPKDGPNA